MPVQFGLDIALGIGKTCECECEIIIAANDAGAREFGGMT